MRNTKVPKGWDVREPVPDSDGRWRIIALPGTVHACVVDSKPTEEEAIVRLHEIIANRERVYRNHLRRAGFIV